MRAPGACRFMFIFKSVLLYPGSNTLVSHRALMGQVDQEDSQGML